MRFGRARIIWGSKYRWLSVLLISLGAIAFECAYFAYTMSILESSSRQHASHAVLKGALVNVPRSDYDDQGYASLTLGMIRQVKIRHRHTSISRQVARSQFIMPEWTWYGLANRTQIKRFMFHDHDTGNRKNILAALRHWERRFLLKKYFKMGDF